MNKDQVLMKYYIVDAYLFFVKYQEEKSIFSRLGKTTKWEDSRTLWLDMLIKTYGIKSNKFNENIDTVVKQFINIGMER